jgi:hypothetical protein
MAPVTTPKVVAAPVPVSSVSRQDAAPIIIETLRAKSGSATSREPRTRGRVGPRVESGRAINREPRTRGSITKRRLRGEARG